MNSDPRGEIQKPCGRARSLPIGAPVIGVPVIGALVIGALALLAVTPGSVAGESVDDQAAAFDHFMDAARPICQQRSADECVTLAWRFADADRDQGLSIAELSRIRSGLQDWALRHQDELSRPERSSLALSLLLVDSIGIERLLALYDSDHDGLVSRSELLADVHLDQRPLGEVLLDPVAVDRPAIARRLGLPPALMDHIQP